jgi:hypothetical protein
MRNLIVLVWLFAFWWLAYSWILGDGRDTTPA